MQRVKAASVLLLVSVFSFALVPMAFAQSIGTTDALSVATDPQYPTPYGIVTLTPSSTLFDINGATVTVTVNGVQQYKGSGGTPIQVTVGGPGVLTRIVVSASAGGQAYSQSFTIRPEQVALVTEPVSTTHAFYEGKGLISPEGDVRFVAIPDLRNSAGTSIDLSTLEYTWYMNDQILESSSGIGKSVLDAQAPQRYRDVTVSVVVQNSDGSLIAQAQAAVSPVDPTVRIYEDDPLLGPLFNTALSDQTTMTSDEETYIGVPYYFSETPTLEWDVNGAVSGSNPDITVRASGNGQGTADLSLTATQSDTTQTANSTLAVAFGAAPSSGIFGL